MTMTSKYQVVPTTLEHVFELAENMREEDVAEVWAASHVSPIEAITGSMLYTEDTLTGLADGRVLCIFGIGQASLISLKGLPWFLSTDLVDEHPLAMARGSMIVFKNMIKHSGFTQLENYVDARYAIAVRWLEWLGFTVSPPAPYGADQLPFHKFTWEL